MGRRKKEQDIKKLTVLYHNVGGVKLEKDKLNFYYYLLKDGADVYVIVDIKTFEDRHKIEFKSAGYAEPYIIKGKAADDSGNECRGVLIAWKQAIDDKVVGRGFINNFVWNHEDIHGRPIIMAAYIDVFLDYTRHRIAGIYHVPISQHVEKDNRYCVDAIFETCDKVYSADWPTLESTTKKEVVGHEELEEGEIAEEIKPVVHLFGDLNLHDDLADEFRSTMYHELYSVNVIPDALPTFYISYEEKNSLDVICIQQENLHMQLVHQPFEPFQLDPTYGRNDYHVIFLAEIGKNLNPHKWTSYTPRSDVMCSGTKCKLYRHCKAKNTHLWQSKATTLEAILDHMSRIESSVADLTTLHCNQLADLTITVSDIERSVRGLDSSMRNLKVSLPNIVHRELIRHDNLNCIVIYNVPEDISATTTIQLILALAKLSPLQYSIKERLGDPHHNSCRPVKVEILNAAKMSSLSELAADLAANPDWSDYRVESMETLLQREGQLENTGNFSTGAVEAVGMDQLDNGLEEYTTHPSIASPDVKDATTETLPLKRNARRSSI